MHVEEVCCTRTLNHGREKGKNKTKFLIPGTDGRSKQDLLSILSLLHLLYPWNYSNKRCRYVPNLRKWLRMLEHGLCPQKKGEEKERDAQRLSVYWRTSVFYSASGSKEQMGKPRKSAPKTEGEALMMQRLTAFHHEAVWYPQATWEALNYFGSIHSKFFRWVSYKHHIVRSNFLIRSAKPDF